MKQWSADDERELTEAELTQRDLDGELRDVIRSYRRGAGLAADEATVAWFLAEYHAGRQEPGAWETAAESSAVAEREQLIDAGAAIAKAYVERNSEDFARWWWSWRQGVPTQVFAFKRDVDAHRGALVGLHPHPEVIEVVKRPRERPPKLRRSAAQRAQGRHERREQQMPAFAVPWQLWSVDATGRELTVHYRTGAANDQPEVQYDEDDRAVRVTVLERLPKHGGKLMGETRHATIALDAPLSSRAVIDTTTGDSRPQKRA